MASRKSTAERFWAKVNKTDSCWLWTAAKNWGGYGQFDGQVAHRFAYKLLVGPIPDGMVLDHLCCVRNCVNPEHLRVCTRAENVLAPHSVSPTALNQRKTHCPKGHPYEGRNLMMLRGRRNCRICHNAYYRNQRAEVRERKPPASRTRKTHCKYGHPFDEANTRHRSNGARRCRVCCRRWVAECKERAKARTHTQVTTP